MISLNAKPFVWTIRLYRGEDGYDSREPYFAILTATVFGERAFISGLHGEFDRACWRELEKWFLSIGVTTVEMERRGKLVTVVTKGTGEKSPHCCGLNKGRHLPSFRETGLCR